MSCCVVADDSMIYHELVDFYQCLMMVFFLSILLKVIHGFPSDSLVLVCCCVVKLDD